MAVWDRIESVRWDMSVQSKGAFVSIREDVEKLATTHGRQVGTPGHDAARDHIVSRLADLGIDGYAGGPFELPYQRGGQGFVNLVAQLPGTNPSLSPVLLGAHYDTCGDMPGADDNAAAVAVLLAVAETLKGKQIDRTVLFAFFDAEEPPHFLMSSMGSIRFYEDQRREPIHCAIIMDLVGHEVPIPGLEDLVFILGMESDPDLETLIKEGEPASAIRTVPILNAYLGDLSDHHVFRINKRPYLLLTCGRWEHYHSRTDTPEKLAYPKIEAITDYMSGLTERLCAASLTGPFEGYDTSETELYFLRKTIQPVIDQMGLGLVLKSRDDINSLVRLMTMNFDL